MGDQQVALDIKIHPIGAARVIAGEMGEESFILDISGRRQIINPLRPREGFVHDQPAVVGIDGDVVAEGIASIEQVDLAIVQSAVDLADVDLSVGAGRRGEIEILVFVKRAVVAPADRLAIT